MDTIGKKLLLSAGIGLGVAVSGVSLYLLLKPENDPYLNRDNDKRKIRQTNQSVVTIRVPKQYVGAVIGRGGEHIKRIQSDTKTRINFDDSNTGSNSKDNNGLKEVRVLLIKGTPESTAKAEMAINEIIREQSMITTKHFSVDTNAIGGIIGRNGDNIRYFRPLFVTTI
jgi:transcription antitermination factor NusA-like protein